MHSSKSAVYSHNIYCTLFKRVSRGAAGEYSQPLVERGTAAYVVRAEVPVLFGTRPQHGRSLFPSAGSAASYLSFHFRRSIKVCVSMRRLFGSFLLESRAERAIVLYNTSSRQL